MAWASSSRLPNAKCYMLPEDLNLYNVQYEAKLDEWEPVMGKNNVCRKKAENIIPLTTGYLELEGERLEVFDHVMGDYRWNSVVWIPRSRPFTAATSSSTRPTLHLRGHGSSARPVGRRH